MKWQDRTFFLKELELNLFPLLLIIADKPEEQQNLSGEIEALVAHQDIPKVILTHENFTLDKFYQEVETVPFLSRKRALFIQGIDRLPKPVIDKITAYATSPNQWTILVLIASKLAANSKLYKSCASTGGVLHLQTKKPWEVEKEIVDWLIHLAAKEGVVLQIPGAKAFISALGIDRTQLQGELQKVLCYIGDRKEITPADIAAISSFIPHETIWKLIDLLLKKETSKALVISRTLLNQEISIFSLLPTLRTQMQTPLQILSHYQSGGYPAVTSAFPYLRGGLLEKKVQEAIRLGAKFFQKAIVQIGVADRQLRSQTTDPTQILERLVIELGAL